METSKTTNQESSYRISRDAALMATAVIFSHRSTCRRRKVGAIIAIEGRIVSTGYAEAPAGSPACSETICNVDVACTRTVHAEMNAIVFAARKGVAIEGGTLYTTASPCLDCAKAIINAGIQRVVYFKYYRDTRPLDLLESVGINCQMSTLDLELPDVP